MARTADTVNFIAPGTALDITGNYQTIDSITGSGNGMLIADFFNGRDNMGFLVINNTTVSAKDVTLIAGGVYPQSTQGNKVVSCAASKVTIIPVDEPARFSNADGALAVEFAASMTGSACPVAFKTALGL